jgi:ATP-binding cassette subfamily F protein 3
LQQIQPDTGQVIQGQGLNVGYFDQQLHVLDDSMQVVDAIRPKSKKIFEEPARRNLLGAFGLTGDQQLQTVGSLSGGQRCRAALALLSAEDANVLILDEPTNHLDLWARAGLEKAIRNFEGTVLFISHDRYFVDQVADHLLIIQPDARFKTLDGNYSTFRHMVSKGLMADPFLTDAAQDRKAAAGVGKAMVSTIKTADNRRQTADGRRQQKDETKAETKPIAKIKAGMERSAMTEKKPRKFPYRKVHDIEEEIFARETQIMAWNEDLLRPEVVRDSERVRSIHQEIQAEQETIALLYEHWEEANERN